MEAISSLSVMVKINVIKEPIIDKNSPAERKVRALS